MKESAVWARFKVAWPYHAERLEPGIGAGIPDVLVLDRLGRPGFVELKAPDDVVLNPNQWIWHEMWHKGKGKIVVVTCQSYGRDMLLWRVFVPLFKPRTLHELTTEPCIGSAMVYLVAKNLGLTT